MKANSLIGALLCVAVHGIAVPTFDTRAASTLQWVDCPELPANVSAVFQCANLSVPLDYEDKDCNKTLTLNLLKQKASRSPSKGSVLMNPGGPGFGGRNSLYNILSLVMVRWVHTIREFNEILTYSQLHWGLL
jgi:hypothetical protein